LVVQAGEMLGVYERVIRGDEGRVRYHYVLIDFLCRPVGGDVKAGSDAADVRWFTRDELPALNLADDTNDVVLKGLARTMERGASSPGQRDVHPHTSNS
jgi:8-oxo-dGTP diphosphatase